MSMAEDFFETHATFDLHQKKGGAHNMREQEAKNDKKLEQGHVDILNRIISAY